MTRPRTYATPALILRRVDSGEADRLVTILTPAYGRLVVTAKGVRKMTSRKAGHIELFTHTQLFLARGRTFDIVTQAELIDSHMALREDLQRGGAAHVLIELVDRLAQEDHEDAELFDAACESVQLLCRARDARLALRCGELRLLQVSGYRPQLFRCAAGGAALPVDQSDASGARTVFSPSAGGVLSEAAALQARDGVSLSRSALLLLRALQTQPYDALDALDVPEDVHAELERALGAYVSFVTERRLRTPGVVRGWGDPLQSKPSDRSPA
jgi:DNA repair protein RecO (recombination protein O)